MRAGIVMARAAKSGRESNNSPHGGQALSATSARLATERGTRSPSLISRKAPDCDLLQPMPMNALDRCKQASFVQDNGAFPMP
jgi:hypothetical protein